MMKEIILKKLIRDHRGINNAIKRKNLLQYCKVYDPTLTDRELRKLVKEIPLICTCEKGYFIAQRDWEVKYSIQYLKKKIYPLWEDIRKIEKAYSKILGNHQQELF